MENLLEKINLYIQNIDLELCDEGQEYWESYGSLTTLLILKDLVKTELNK